MSEQIERLRKASMAVYLATEKDVADDLSNMLRAAADHIAELEALLRRYRNETPLGHQPHMIAHKVDALLGGGE